MALPGEGQHSEHSYGWEGWLNLTEKYREFKKCFLLRDTLRNKSTASKQSKGIAEDYSEIRVEEITFLKEGVGLPWQGQVTKTKSIMA